MPYYQLYLSAGSLLIRLASFCTEGFHLKFVLNLAILFVYYLSILGHTPLTPATSACGQSLRTWTRAKEKMTIKIRMLLLWRDTIENIIILIVSHHGINCITILFKNTTDGHTQQIALSFLKNYDSHWNDRITQRYLRIMFFSCI